MKHNKKFIWLDSSLYPEHQRDTYCMAEFKKKLQTKAPIEIEICAHARYLLYVNGEYATSGVDTTDIVSGDVYSFKAE